MTITVKDVHDEIGEFFGEYIPYRTTVVVAGANSEFRLFINVGDAPDTARALNWNVGYNGLIMIKSPAMVSDFKQTLKHQMARIAVRTRQEHYKSLPEWYQEGVASYVAGDLTPAQRVAVCHEGGNRPVDVAGRHRASLQEHDDLQLRRAGVPRRPVAGGGAGR